MRPTNNGSIERKCDDPQEQSVWEVSVTSITAQDFDGVTNHHDDSDHRHCQRNRSELVTTLIELRAMSKPALLGDRVT